jgi:hypothetical protein
MLAVLTLGMLLAACSGGESTKQAAEPETSDEGSASLVEPVLVIDGKHVNPDGTTRRDPAASATDEDDEKPRRVRSTKSGDDEEWPEPPLNGDGTIDDGPDPFEGERVAVQAIPIEDDAQATAGIDAAAARMRRVDREEWDRWMAANDDRSPWQQGDDAFAASLVDITVERCGGARTVATGVVLADETVVTTVHAIESASKRVRVSSTVGEGPRIPAMIRYLDIDDDVAVLKVPGLRVRPMPVYVPSGTDPRMGYAYGVANVGVSGALRRTPVLVSTQETSITLEQPDGFAQEISDRQVQTLVGGITTGFSGGVVAVTNDPNLATGFGFHGLIRARVPFRADTAGIVVPSRIVRDAVTASGRLDEWYEHRPGGCPKWRR